MYATLIFVILHLTLVINMSNASKCKISVSKRHIRRIIEDETNIDIAGSSTQIIKHTQSPTTNRSFKDNYLDLHKISDINIYAFNKNITNETLNAEIEISENKNENTDMQIDHDSNIDNSTRK